MAKNIFTIGKSASAQSSGGLPGALKHWEIIADKLSAAGWSLGYCSAVTKDTHPITGNMETQD